MKRCLLILSFLLSSCAIGPDYEKPDLNLPQKWENSSSNQKVDLKTDAQWWKSFQDPILNQLIDDLLQSNPDYREALARIDEAHANVRSATAALLPQVDGTGSYARDLNSQNSSTGNRLPRETSSFDMGAQTNWEIDLFGRLRRADEAATAAYESQIADTEYVLLSLISELAQNYVMLRQTQAEFAATQKNAKAWKDIVQLNKSLFQAGRISEVDLLQAKTNQEQTESQLAPLAGLIKTTMHQLSVLTGRNPADLYELFEKLQPIPQIQGEIFANLPSTLLERRPDIKKAERDLASQTAQIGVAIGDLLPKFSFTGDVGFSSNKSRNWFNHGSFNSSFGPTFTWSIIDFGRVRANIAAQEALRDQAYYHYKSVVLTALKEVEDALVNLSSEGQRLTQLQAAYKLSSESASLSQSRYQAGLEDFIVVLNTEITRNTQELNMIQSQGNLSLNAINLYKALGGGWQVEKL